MSHWSTSWMLHDIAGVVAGNISSIATLISGSEMPSKSKKHCRALSRYFLSNSCAAPIRPLFQKQRRFRRS
jgi:hypothetical protein